MKGSEEQVAEGNSWTCDLGRLDGRGVDVQAFAHRHPKVPVILSNLTVGWRAHKDWANGGFVEEYGHLRIPVREQLVDESGSHWREKVHEMDIADFVASAAHRGKIAVEFNPVDLVKAMWQDLEPEVSLFKGLQGERLLSVGVIGTGSGLHNHEENWVAQVVGRKAWLVAPPSHGPDFMPLMGSLPCPLYHHGQRMAEHGRPGGTPHASMRGNHLQACVVEPGETIHLPPLWYHGTCNLDRLTVAVGGRGDSSKRPDIHDACHLCNGARLGRLLGEGADPGVVYGKEGRPLHVAAISGCGSAVEQLLEHGTEVASSEDFEVSVAYGMREGDGRGLPLHLASMTP